MSARDLYTNTEHDAARYEAAHNEDDFDISDVLDADEYGEYRQQIADRGRSSLRAVRAARWAS